MPKFRYILVVKGEIEARNRTNAHLNLLMGTSLSARLIASPHELAIELREVGPASSPNGKGRDVQHVRPFLEGTDGGD